jgi:hypothetical protein
MCIRTAVPNLLYLRIPKEFLEEFSVKILLCNTYVNLVCPLRFFMNPLEYAYHRLVTALLDVIRRVMVVDGPLSLSDERFFRKYFSMYYRFASLFAVDRFRHFGLEFIEKKFIFN